MKVKFAHSDTDVCPSWYIGTSRNKTLKIRQNYILVVFATKGATEYRNSSVKNHVECGCKQLTCFYKLISRESSLCKTFSKSY